MRPWTPDTGDAAFFTDGCTLTAASGTLDRRYNNRVVALAAGATSQTVLPFTGLYRPDGVAVDGNGTVYVTDSHNNRVLAQAAE